MFNNCFRLTFFSFLITLCFPGALVAASEPDTAAAGVRSNNVATTFDPAIPTHELALLLRPLSKNELLVEADAWQDLVQEAAREIARVEITIQRENIEIEKEGQLREKVRKVQSKLENLLVTADQAKANKDFNAIPEIQEDITEVQDSMQEIENVVNDFSEAHKKKLEIAKEISRDPGESIGQGADPDAKVITNTDKDRIDEAVKSVRTKTQEKLQEISDEETGETVPESQKGKKDQDQISAASGVVESLEESVKFIEQVEEDTRAEKLALLEKITRLRDKRTRLLDNMRAVIEELSAKTDQNDSDTIAKITDYQLYIDRVSGIHVDVTDTTSTWITLKGWVVSDQGGKRWALNATRFVGILFVALVLARLFSGMVRKVSARLSMPALLGLVLISSTRWLVIGIGMIWALSALEFSIAPLLAMVGAAGFVIAFAMQDSLSNFAAGLMILIFRPFDVDDLVDAGGVSGKVKSMNLVSTTIKTPDNKLMIVPNSKIWNEVITNATGVTQRRVDMVFGIGYDDDIDHAQAILEEIVAKHPLVLKYPEPTIKVSELADSSVNFICRPWVSPKNYWEVYWDVTKEVKKRFDAEEIGIPFPQREVHLHISDSSAAVAGEKLAGTKDVRSESG